MTLRPFLRLPTLLVPYKQKGNKMVKLDWNMALSVALGVTLAALFAQFVMPKITAAVSKFEESY